MPRGPSLSASAGQGSSLRQGDGRTLLSQTGAPFQECGIPKHFGLFYAMGTALMMEGLLSACYHVCPNYTNFQFGELRLAVG